MKNLSFIIPAYNAAPYLTECVESLFQQDFPAEQFEVILINDGSTDTTADVMERLGQLYPNIRLIHKVNEGVAKTRNKGICEAQGEYLMFVDADDALIPHSLLPVLNTALRTQADLTRFDLLKVRDEELRGRKRTGGKASGNGTESHANNNTEAETMTGTDAYCHRYDPNEGYCFRYLFRTAFLREEALHFLTGVKMMEDVELVERALLKAQKVVILPVHCYLYRQNDASCLYTMNPSKLCDIATVTDSLAKFYRTEPQPSEVRHTQVRNLYNHLNILLWYLTHHCSLYARRKEVMKFLRSLMDVFPTETLPMKWRLQVEALRHCPALYLALRFRLTKRKFD